MRVYPSERAHTRIIELRLTSYLRTVATMDRTTAEIASQPGTWAAAIQTPRVGLPRAGSSVAVLGCGTSFYVAQAYARLREEAGHGQTTAHVASEYAVLRPVDHVMAISRSGTTSEVVSAIGFT